MAVVGVQALEAQRGGGGLKGSEQLAAEDSIGCDAGSVLADVEVDPNSEGVCDGSRGGGSPKRFHHPVVVDDR
jgi:hypothetical protein